MNRTTAQWNSPSIISVWPI